MLTHYNRQQIISGMNNGEYEIQDLYFWLSNGYIDIIDFWYIQDAYRIKLLK